MDDLRGREKRIRESRRYARESPKELANRQRANRRGFRYPGKVEGNTVFTYLDAFSRPEHFQRYLPDYASLDELKAHYRRGGLGDVKVKKFLIAVLNETLEPIRERRKQYEGRIEEVYEILRKGSEHARATAAQTLGEVRHAMRIDYFDDKELIAEQARQYQQQR